MLTNNSFLDFFNIVCKFVYLFTAIILTMLWKFDSGVMCFYPTKEEFRDFSGVVKYMETQGAHKYGVAKVSNPFFSLNY